MTTLEWSCWAGRTQCATWTWSLPESPERAGQPKAVEDRLVLLPRMRPPVRGETIAPPGVRELSKLRDRDRGARRAPGEPGDDVVFRPEEQHRPSGEPDVLPPRDRRDEDVEHEILIVGTAVPHLDLEWRVAVGALGADDAVDVESRSDAERVPGAIRVPRCPSRFHAKWRRLGGKWVGHADLAGGVEDECVAVVESSPRVANLSLRPVRESGHLRRRGRPPELGEHAVGRISELDIGRVHREMIAAAISTLTAHCVGGFRPAQRRTLGRHGSRVAECEQEIDETQQNRLHTTGPCDDASWVSEPNPDCDEPAEKDAVVEDSRT